MNENTENIIGIDSQFIDVLEQTSALAQLKKPVLIIGERGTGKELIAHRLHYLSPWWQGPFISINCSALNENLLDSELFGHEAGAFTGAKNRHQGRFERADGGSLFLDELATAPMLVQEKLLRVIEYGHLERVGGSQSLHVDVRLICATNADLPTMAEEGKFRADLLDRLAFDVIKIPPLRERPADIMLLAENFAIAMCQELGLAFFPGFSEEAQQVLLDYSWPGNIRELKNVVERSVYRHGTSDSELDNIIIDPFARLKSSTVITPITKKEPNSNHIILPKLPLDLRHWQSETEKEIVEHALKASRYNQKLAAKKLSLSYDQLRGLIKKHGISANE
ncbi:phage shock protein operon transcriptional activator [Proteus myxofaciens]|uniref:Psp operon transcriptional activator n=1 Tax=Proteus myxofaciens ATCC 19692 TaxID=1354337 RepID=A0A198FB94_9GAMM|nr:phage shock protein operon transcriptional activator [Proteus myxofaciens]OAT21541.1 Psp operon transcriptional activator [Proteus myxofaciens ATCC 19692]